MRDVKYRAYNKEKGMFFVESLNWVNGKLIDYDVLSDTDLMQYVGQKDKNFTEIYEDDIVMYKGQYICRVMFYEKSCSFVLQYKDESGNKEYYRIIQGVEMEVVGNIHQDSHLLS